jgi:hypothetical protein
MPVSSADLKALLDQLDNFKQQLEALKAKAAQEELTSGREGYAAPRLTRKA